MLDLFVVIPVDLALSVAARCVGRDDEVGERVAAVRRFGESFDAPMVLAEADASAAFKPGCWRWCSD